MKKLLMVLLARFARGHARQIAKAQKWIDSAQMQFASAIEEAEIAEKKFMKIASKKEDQLAQILEEIGEATGKAKQAENFKNKIKQFIEE